MIQIFITRNQPNKFQHLTRAEKVVITRLRIDQAKATNAHILSRGPPIACHYCGQTPTIDHMVLECTVLQQSCDDYYRADSLNIFFESSRCLYNIIPDRTGIILSDLNDQSFDRIPHLNHPRTDASFSTSTRPRPGQYNQARFFC